MNPFLRMLAEAFEQLHPRDRYGRFTDKPDFDIGVTPYRGAGRSHGAAYYNTTRWKGFERAVPRVAEQTGVVFQSLQPARGVWAGGGEPSAQVHVAGAPDRVQHLMDELGGMYDQDAVIGFRPCKPCPSVRYVSAETVAPERAEQALREVDLPGGTITEDGHLELIDTEDSQFDQVASLADTLDINFKVEKGDGFLRFAGQDYQKRSGQRRAQEAASSFRGDGPARPAGVSTRDG